MNSETKTLERQLESATARDIPPNASLDQETGSLREAWLAFGQLLEVARPASDALRLPADPPGRGGRWWLLVTVVGLAASLLVASMITWVGRKSGSAVVLTTTPAPVHVAVKGVEPSPPAKKPASPAGSGSAPAWDDALDKEITVAGEAVVSAAQDGTHLAGAGTTLRYGLEEVQKDIENSPL
jgi:hypothetical protein